MPFHFANVLLFSATAILFVFGSLLAGSFLRPNAPNREKSMIYECGEKPIGHAWFNFNPRFYLIALVFVIFEVEIAFMYPVASVYKWIIDLARKSSIFYLLFGLACCGIELMQTGGPRADIDRFGSVPRATPRQSDLMIVAGTLTYKMAERCRLLYEQMAEPKYVISMGSCASCGGLFQYAYSVCKGVDKLVPVDIYVPGCPPRPEALTEGLMRVQDKIIRERWFTDRQKIGQAKPSLGIDYSV